MTSLRLRAVAALFLISLGAGCGSNSSKSPDATPDGATPDGATPDSATPDSVAHDSVTSDDATSDDAMSNDATSNDATSDDASSIAPTAVSQVVTAPSGSSTPITLTAHAKPGATLEFTVVDQPQHGTLSGDAPHLTYVSASGYKGLDTLTFTVSDGTNTSAPGTVSIFVTGAIFVNGTNGDDANDGKTAAHAKKTMQAGIDAVDATFDLVVVAAGTYAETLKITKSLTLRGPMISGGSMVVGSNEPTVIVQPLARDEQDVSPATIIDIDAPLAKVNIESIKLDGSILGQGLASTVSYSGILLHPGVTAKLYHVYVANVRLRDEFFGMQTGFAISALQADLDVEYSIFSGFQKRAISVEGSTLAQVNPTHLIVNESQFIGTDPTAFASPTVISQNAVEPLDQTEAIITNNLFENIGPSGTSQGANVAPDGTWGYAILYWKDYKGQDELVYAPTVSGNTFTNVQGIYYDNVYGVPGSSSFVGDFVAGNTITGGLGMFFGTPSNGTSIDGFLSKANDTNRLNIEIQLTSSTCTGASDCVVSLLPGDYTLTCGLQALPPGGKDITLKAVGGEVNLSIPNNSALPTGYALGAGVNVTYDNGKVCPI